MEFVIWFDRFHPASAGRFSALYVSIVPIHFDGVVLKSI